MDWLTLITMIKTHAWLPLAVFLVGFLVRTTSKDSKWPVNIPSQWQPVIVIGLSDVYGVLSHWSDARAHGAGFDPSTMLDPAVLTAFVVLTFRAVYFNKPEPAWFAWLAGVLTPPPAAKPVIKEEPKDPAPPPEK